MEGADRSARTLPEPPLLVITQENLTPRGLEEQIAGALAGGCRWVLLRDKDLNPERRRDLLMRLLPAVREVRGTLSVSDDLELARLADGCHLNRKGNPARAREVLGASAFIGVSAHDLAEARYAEKQGADYVTLSPIFPPISKPSYGPVLGTERLAEVAEALSIPVIALGGVTPTQVAPCLEAGAQGVAALGEIMSARDSGKEVIKIIQELTSVNESKL